MSSASPDSDRNKVFKILDRYRSGLSIKKVALIVMLGLLVAGIVAILVIEPSKKS